MTDKAASNIPTIFFGAYDRHNFGDLLFPHVAAAMLPAASIRVAGLAARDLRRSGGYRVEALVELAAELGERPVNVLHVGGEILTCEAWEAAVMLLAPELASATIARYDTRPREALAWARSELGMASLAPYVLGRSAFTGTVGLVHDAVGGVDFDQRASPMRAEVLAKLREADLVTVRDRETLAQLAAAGIEARLLPDPALMVGELFGAKIDVHAHGGDVARIRKRFPQGYFALQFSADFGDDATLDEIAAQLGQATVKTGAGLVLFRAGAAPWHDDPACYHRLAARLPAGSVRLFRSLNIWDICALIAHSGGFIGSSLHARIVAMACGRPRLNVRPRATAGQRSKQAAFAATWEIPGMPGVVETHDIATGLDCALATDARRLGAAAGEWVAEYRRGFAAICRALR